MLAAILAAVLAAPVADAGDDVQAACAVAGGATVVLDGSRSSDRDSTPGTSDDIVKFAWTEGGASLADGAKPTVVLPVGIHTLTLTVTDREGLSATDDVQVVIADEDDPVVGCPPDVTAECTQGAAEVALAPAQGKDVCFGLPDTIVNDRTAGGPDASGTYPLRVTVVTFTAADAAGNTGACEMTVTIEDTQAPSLALEVAPRSLWPPNQALRPVHVAARASDACDASPSIVLDSISSNDRLAADDIQGASLGTADFEVLLRAAHPGRVYTLRYRVVDGSRNAVERTATVRVEK